MKKRIIKYLKISEILSDRIRKEFKDGEILPSEQSLALEFGVSLKTIFRAINRLKNLGLVRSLPKVGNFAVRRFTNIRKQPFQILYPCVLPSSAQSLRHEKLVTRYDRYIWDQLKAVGCEIRPIDPHLISQGEIQPEMTEGLDGFLFSGFSLCFSPLALEFSRNLCRLIPGVLFLYEKVITLPCSQILIDHDEGMRLCLEASKNYHLDGCICFYQNNLNNKMRCLSFCRNAEQYGYHDIQSVVVEVSRNPFSIASSIAEKCRNKLIFVSCDMISPEILKALVSCGLIPSKDFHLCSFDDVESLRCHPFPEEQITSISYSRERICDLAVETLMNSIQQKGKNADFRFIAEFQPSLKIRKSGFARFS